MLVAERVSFENRVIDKGNIDDAEAQTESESEEEFRVLFCKTKGERLK